MPGPVLVAAEARIAKSGFFGKLPARRDFVTGSLPRSVVDPLYACLEEGLVRSRELIGEDWLDAYLNMPVWRFALAAGLCGEDAVGGVLIPNLDKVGRHFPLAVLALLPGAPSPVEVSLDLAGWYDAAEALALSSLEPGFEFERFECAVEALTVPEPDRAGFPPSTPDDDAGWPVRGGGWRLAAPPDGSPARAYAGLFEESAALSFVRFGIWWTAGSERVPASMLVHRDIPGATPFTALLDGRWSEHGWGKPSVLGAGG